MPEASVSSSRAQRGHEAVASSLQTNYPLTLTDLLCTVNNSGETGRVLPCR